MEVEGLVALITVTEAGAASVELRGKVVDRDTFQKPIVDSHREELLALRAQLRSGGGMRGAGGMDITPLINKLSSLEKTVKELEIRQPIILQGTLDGQKFLRRHMSKYREFEEHKYPDQYSNRKR